RTGGDDRVLEHDLLRLVALDAERARILEQATADDDLDALGLRDRRKPARETADDALRLPLAQRIQIDARRAEVHAELARALGFREQARDVEQRLRRDTALEQTRAAELLVGVDDDRLETELGAAKRRGVAAGPAAEHGDVDFLDQIPHHHVAVVLLDVGVVFLTSVPDEDSRNIGGWYRGGAVTGGAGMASDGEPEWDALVLSAARRAAV